MAVGQLFALIVDTRLFSANIEKIPGHVGRLISGLVRIPKRVQAPRVPEGVYVLPGPGRDRALDLGGQDAQMLGEPCGQFSLLRVGRQVADQSAFGRIDPELFQVRRHVFHRSAVSGRSDRACAQADTWSQVDDLRFVPKGRCDGPAARCAGRL
jgi:hypothetical protein